MRYAKWVGLASLALASLVASADKDCEYTKKPSDAYTDGEQKANPTYPFRYISAARKEGRTYQYKRILANVHKMNYLPAEWLKAAIDFGDIAPEECGTNSFTSKLKPDEDPKTVIKYGPLKDKTFPAGLISPIHTPKGAGGGKKGEDKKDGDKKDKGKESGDTEEPAADDPFPPLESSIVATVMVLGEKRRIDYRVTSEFKDGWVTTLASVAKSKEPTFAIMTPLSVEAPAIDAAMKMKMAGTKSSWTKDKDEMKRFKIGEATEAMVFKPVFPPVERQVKVTLYYSTRDGNKKVGSGLISLYLPTFEKPREKD